MAKIASPVADYDNAKISCLITDINHSNGTEVWAYAISLSLPLFIEVPVPMQVNE